MNKTNTIQVIMVLLLASVACCLLGQVQEIQEYPTTDFKRSALSISTTPAVVASMPRRYIQIINLGTETIWIGIGTTTAAIGAPNIPVYGGQDWLDLISPSIPISVVASVTATATVNQGR